MNEKSSKQKPQRKGEMIIISHCLVSKIYIQVHVYIKGGAILLRGFFGEGYLTTDHTIQLHNRKIKQWVG